MEVRKALGLAVTTPALVLALAQPSDAASADVVTFGGTITITPTALPQQQQLDVCFSALAACASAEPTGMAAGTAVDRTTLAAEPVDALRAKATYVEVCAPATGIQPVGSAQLSGAVHKTLSGTWSPELDATWTRAGLVAVISGRNVAGTALFTPAGPAQCGRPVQVAVAGAVALTY